MKQNTQYCLTYEANTQSCLKYKQNTQSCLKYALTISCYAHFNTSKILFTFLSSGQSVRQSAMIFTGLHYIICSATISNEMCTRGCLLLP